MGGPPRADAPPRFADPTLTLVRRVLLVFVVLGAVGIAAVLIFLGPADPVIASTFPVLLVLVVAFAWVLLRRPGWVIWTSRIVLSLLVVAWLVIMAVRLKLPPAEGGGWATLFPSTFMGLALFVVIGYVTYRTRVAMLHAALVVGSCTVVGLVALGNGPEGGAHVADLLRFAVYLVVLTGMVHILSRTKEHAARAFLVAESAMEEAETMREMAYRDPLTGVANRRRLLEELAYQARTAGEGIEVAVVYLDVDHFKTINDEQGHLVGDQVLAAVAAVIQRHVRPGHLVARLGGEEFVVVAPGMTLAVAREMAEGLRRTLPVGVARETGIRVTASFGVAVLQHEEAPTAVLERVDALMYQAKRAGRDTVVTAAVD